MLHRYMELIIRRIRRMYVRRGRLFCVFGSFVCFEFSGRTAGGVFMQPA